MLLLLVGGACCRGDSIVVMGSILGPVNTHSMAREGGGALSRAHEPSPVMGIVTVLLLIATVLLLIATVNIQCY